MKQPDDPATASRERCGLDEFCMNPATGMPMIDGCDGFDVSGYLFGTCESYDLTDVLTSDLMGFADGF